MRYQIFFLRLEHLFDYVFPFSYNFNYNCHEKKDNGPDIIKLDLKLAN